MRRSLFIMKVPDSGHADCVLAHKDAWTLDGLTDMSAKRPKGRESANICRIAGVRSTEQSADFHNKKEYPQDFQKRKISDANRYEREASERTRKCEYL